VPARTRTRWPNLAPARLARRLVDLLGPTGGAARQSLVALVFNSVTSFAAGLILVGLAPTAERLPGLIILVTPSIGLGGNIFTSLGNRLSTSIHIGSYANSLRPRSILGQNLIAGFTLTMFMSVVLALMAKVIIVVFGIDHALSLLDLLMISILGALISDLPVAFLTVALARGAVRFGWDLDNLVAPVVSTLGDVLTIPALWLAALIVGHGKISPIMGAVLTAFAVGSLFWVFRSRLSGLTQIVKESLPVLTAALVLDTLGGLVLQKQLDALYLLPAILVLQPAFVSTGGALGGILCGRVATKLHLGTVEPTAMPGVEVRRDTAFLLGLTVPIFVFNAAGATIFAHWTHSTAPGWWWTLAVALVAAAITMVFVIATSYYTTIGAWRIEVDPDSYGVPLVCAGTDFVGTVALIAVVALFALR
jgi:mgtE-like transporter